VVAAEPSFSDELLARCLVAAYDQKLDVLIVLNKCDLFDAEAAARKRLIPYPAIGYRVLELSAKIAPVPSTLENAEQPASQEGEGGLWKGWTRCAHSSLGIPVCWSDNPAWANPP
jgi:RsgA GTPase